MQTHEDFDYARLEARAAEVMRRTGSTITAGKTGEASLDKWEHGGVHIQQLPPDEHNILRVSIGGGVPGVDLNYCVFRGDRILCAELLEKALAAIRRPR